MLKSVKESTAFVKSVIEGRKNPMIATPTSMASIESHDLFNAVITALFTVVSGLFLYLLKGIVDDVWISHVRQYRLLKSEVAFTLVKYANVYMNVTQADKATEGHKDAATDLREVASKIAAFAVIRPKICWMVPRKSLLIEVEKELIGLSNGMFTDVDISGQREHNRQSVDSIQKKLGIEVM